MHTLVRLLIPVLVLCCLQQASGQEAYQKKIQELKAQRELVAKEEKEALKKEKSSELREGSNPGKSKRLKPSC